MVAIKNCKLVLENSVVEGKAILYTDKIEGIVDEKNIPCSAEVIDAEGGYVTP